MNKYFVTSLIFAVILIGGHFISTYFGWYREYWFTDVILHVSSGVLAACIWIWLTENYFAGSPLLFCISIVAMALLSAFLWEVWEFGFWGIVPKLFRSYVPTLSDSLSDMAWGLLGGSIVGVWYWFRGKEINPTKL